MARPLFQLNPRLALCAKMVRPGKALCDVGADHAYLSIWLLKSGTVPRALATDLRAGPLGSARKNALRYGVGDRLTLRQTDGLRDVQPEEAEDIVIAGMGGETILQIVLATAWLRDAQKYLVLQPMSSAEDLRRGLLRAGFWITREEAVLDSGRPYSVMAVQFVGEIPPAGLLYPYLGRLEPRGEAERLYGEKVVRDLLGRLKGAQRGRSGYAVEELEQALQGIRDDFLSRCSLSPDGRKE